VRGLLWWSPIELVLTEVDVPNFSERATELALVATASLEMKPMFYCATLFILQCAVLFKGVIVRVPNTGDTRAKRFRWLQVKIHQIKICVT